MASLSFNDLKLKVSNALFILFIKYNFSEVSKGTLPEGVKRKIEARNTKF
jgi:hypothetical protein